MDAKSDAPGADDDGSGTAAVLEAARVLSTHKFHATLVYAARPTDVRTVVIDGELLIDEGCPARWDPAEVAATARHEAEALAKRAGL